MYVLLFGAPLAQVRIEFHPAISTHMLGSHSVQHLLFDRCNIMPVVTSIMC